MADAFEGTEHGLGWQREGNQGSAASRLEPGGRSCGPD